MKRPNELYIGDWQENPAEFEITCDDTVDTYFVVENDPYEFDFDCNEVKRVACEVLGIHELSFGLHILTRKSGNTE